jgi:hemerythrin-like domain-containing protein
MTDPVSHWHAEHAVFSRLLDILEKEVDVFHFGGQPSYELMVDIVTYLRHFPDRHHHPRENKAFDILVAHDPKLSIPLERLRQEHRVIATAGEELLKTLNDAASDTLITRASLEAAAAMYLTYYRHHIASEEEDVMPRARQLMSPQDWRDVESVAPGGRDPLFGSKVEAGYRELRRHIAREAEKS